MTSTVALWILVITTSAVQQSGEETEETLFSSVVSTVAGLDAVDLLTVVLSLIGGAIAGLLISAYQGRVRRIEEEKRLDEERKGLLLLITYEIRQNMVGAQGFNEMKQQLEQVRESYLKENEESKLADDETFDKFFDKMVVSRRSNDISVALSSIKTDTWHKANVRLAQLLDADQLSTLIRYYSGIPVFNDVVQRADLNKKETLDYLARMVDATIEVGQEAQTTIRAILANN